MFKISIRKKYPNDIYIYIYIYIYIWGYQKTANTMCLNSYVIYASRIFVVHSSLLPNNIHKCIWRIFIKPMKYNETTLYVHQISFHIRIDCAKIKIPWMIIHVFLCNSGSRHLWHFLQVLIVCNNAPLLLGVSKQAI